MILTDYQLQRVILAVVTELDYDLAKQLDPETAEGGPEEAEELWQRLMMAAQAAL